MQDYLLRSAARLRDFACACAVFICRFGLIVLSLRRKSLLQAALPTSVPFEIRPARLARKPDRLPPNAARFEILRLDPCDDLAGRNRIADRHALSWRRPPT